MSQALQQIFNQANTTNFVVSIPHSNTTSAFTLNAQSVPIPGIRIPVTDTVTGPFGLGRAQRPGATFEYDPLIVRFIVDEELKSWIGMYEWMLGTSNYLTGENTAQKTGPEYITLYILDNSKTEIVMSINFYKPWVSDLSEVEFSYTEDSDPALVCTATIPYTYFQVEKDGKIIAEV